METATTPRVSAPTPSPTKSPFENFKEYILLPFDKTLLKTIPELGHLAPIIFTVGAGIISIFTLNYPIFMFALSSAEASLFYRFISSVSSYIITPTVGIDTKEKSKVCESYFQSITSPRFNSLLGKGLRSEFPHYPLYYIVFAAVYCIQGMLYFSKECSELGPQYSNRIYLALLSSIMFIILYSLYLVTNGCDSMMGIFLSGLLGGIVGYLISYQNATLFGKSSVDVLFVPELVKRTGMDYVCVTTKVGDYLTASDTDKGS